ncbi:MAG TPA: bifunctional demethylmenaquinone methyltransferase/2-methoxy-6-polyprenyl-1,4-benzoquinol methylase UbiE [Gammaproteobacteria bacterium]|nr:bifunctional demethylmenaquinone methyltransferase/2-methoxy-6-polyprenyl-1,4-benzoquinol methylase UbiE [Gammaproteobacteria bacterium]
MNDHHFGFEKVSEKQKTKKVQSVFSLVANSYDLMNDVMSLGLHRLWKRQAILLSGVRPGQRVLDLAGGTGDLSSLLQKKVGATGEVILADLNFEMLARGRDRLLNEGAAICALQLNAEQLPFHAVSFDHVFMAFGFRNMTHQTKVLHECLRVLKPGAQLLILEFSKPQNEYLEKAYDFYSFNILPKLGDLIAKDKDSYQYLVESIRMHPNQKKLQHMMSDAGFDAVEYFNLAGGIVAIHRGFKPY